MEAFKWGIIGPGSIANDFADDLKYVSRPQVITSVLSHREESAKAFAEKHTVPEYYTDINAFVSKRNFDAVYIATPHTLHYEQALTCLNAGIPVLCEKPLVINADQVRDLIHAAEINKCFLLEGMWIRFLPSINTVLELIEKDKIGKVISVKASMSYKAPRDEDNRYFNPELGGGSLLDLGIYPVFLSHLLLGKPAKITAAGKLSPDGVDETSAILFSYESGAHALLESSIITQSELSAEIAGDKGVIKIMSPWNEKPSAIILKEYARNEEEELPCEWVGRGFQYQVEEVIRCVEANEIYSNLYCHHFSLDIMETLDEVRRQLHVHYEKFE
ncbi:MAG: Gfo/Idh/MocA family oxidoreductase [Chitinophagaceae bacterium]|nr:MAG: Gfo/Idh/MocA family oxidoreductase [Chitinophagaceae bacterium]